MPLFKIHHVTRYQYDALVKESINEIRIYPYLSNDQEVLSHKLAITGNPSVFTFTDYWGNTTGTFNLLPPHSELVIESTLLVRTQPAQVPLDSTAGFKQLAEEVNGHLNMLELATPDHIQSADAISEIIASYYNPDKSIATIVAESCAYIFNHFQYTKGITTVETTVDEILDHREGVCQDFAHVLLQLLRSMKIPSRYVSGYICPNKNGMRGEGATHAWVEAWLPAWGWAGIDPTNNVWVTDTHVKLAVGRNFNDCSPMKGSFTGQADQELSVYVSVGYEDGHSFEGLNNVNRFIVAEKKIKEQEAAQQ